MEARQRDFGGGNEVQPFARPEEVRLELRKVSGSEKGLGVVQDRGRDLPVPVLARLEVEHERRERARQPRAGAGQHREPGAGQLRAALEVENAERGPEVPVRGRLEVEAARLAPRALDPVGGLVAPAGDRVVGHIRDPLLGRRQLRVDALGLRLELANLLLEGLHLGEGHRIRLSADGGQLVAAATLLLQPGDERAALGVERDEPVEARAPETLREFREQPFRVLAKKLAW